MRAAIFRNSRAARSFLRSTFDNFSNLRSRHAFSLVMAGAGFKGGQVYGATDDFGYKSVENRVSVPDLQVKSIPSARKWGEGILRSADGWANHSEMDVVMEKIYHDRKLERRSQAEDQ